MSAPRPSPRSAADPRCHMAREWVALGLGTAAGVAFLWLCVSGTAQAWPCALLLFLCLTLLGRMTALDRLVALLKAWMKRPAKEKEQKGTKVRKKGTYPVSNRPGTAPAG